MKKLSRCPSYYFWEVGPGFDFFSSSNSVCFARIGFVQIGRVCRNPWTKQPKRLKTMDKGVSCEIIKCKGVRANIKKTLIIVYKYAFVCSALKELLYPINAQIYKVLGSQKEMDFTSFIHDRER